MEKAQKVIPPQVTFFFYVMFYLQLRISQKSAVFDRRRKNIKISNVISDMNERSLTMSGMMVMSRRD